ncbi:A24 family peptidase [Vibrio penaeicida]|uniref:A24 family peptidase n=1 Tax=Vibrio penaeicida TaxID=104609 RepID=UPI000CEA43DD|nr:A24 family peptidase [Vibrio penaeicida]
MDWFFTVVFAVLCWLGVYILHRMNIDTIIQIVLFLGLIATGLATCISDARHRIIPNKYTLIIGAISIALALINGFALESLPYAALVFIVGFVATLIGIWGGGDTKLLTAYALGIMPEFLTLAVILMCMLGGIQIIVMLIRYRGFQAIREKGIAYGIPIVLSCTLFSFVSL